MNYEKATAEIVLFDNCDVITTSGAEENSGCPGSGWENYTGSGSGLCVSSWGGSGNIPQG